jgi:hypothetical protein
MPFQYIDNAVNPNEPLLYRIVINGRFYDIGRANSARCPYRHFERNVRNLKNGKPYRKNKPGGFRAIHRQLCEASESGRSSPASGPMSLTTTARRIAKSSPKLIGRGTLLGSSAAELNLEIGPMKTVLAAPAPARMKTSLPQRISM